MSPVKFREPVRVSRKMRRRPIQNHPEPRRMAAIDKIFEIIRLAVTAGRREIADGLIAPRAVERMLHDRHQLEMGKAQALGIRNQRLSQLAIRKPSVPIRPTTPPRAEMH